MRILCQDCWESGEVSSHGIECAVKTARMLQTPEGRAELEERKREVYARCSAERESSGYAEGFRHAQKAGAPYDALAVLRAGPDDSPALVAARRFNRDREALFLLLLGATGVGKTLAASPVAVDFASKWPWNDRPSGTDMEPIRYVDSSTLTRLSAYDTEAQRYADALRRCPLLILEDAGDEGTDLGKGLMVELLMSRHAARKRTVVTGNLTGDAFRMRYGEAVADRIRATGIVPSLNGEKSRRKRPGLKRAQGER